MKKEIDIRMDISRLLNELIKTHDQEIQNEIIAEIEKCQQELDKIVKKD